MVCCRPLRSGCGQLPDPGVATGSLAAWTSRQTRHGVRRLTVQLVQRWHASAPSRRPDPCARLPVAGNAAWTSLRSPPVRSDR